MYGKKLPSLFKSKGPKQFDFKTRYYDADKERMEKRKRTIENEIKIEQGLANEDARGARDAMRTKWSSHRHQQSKAFNKKVIFIALVLGLAVYFYLYL